MLPILIAARLSVFTRNDTKANIAQTSTETTSEIQKATIGSTPFFSRMASVYALILLTVGSPRKNIPATENTKCMATPEIIVSQRAIKIVKIYHIMNFWITEQKVPSVE